MIDLDTAGSQRNADTEEELLIGKPRAKRAYGLGYDVSISTVFIVSPVVIDGKGLGLGLGATATRIVPYVLMLGHGRYVDHRA